MKALSELTRGEFEPTDLKDKVPNPEDDDLDEWDADNGTGPPSGRVWVSFKWKGKRHKIKLSYHGDWMDGRLESSLNTLLAEYGCSGQFVFLDEVHDQTCQVVYMSKAAILAARDSGILKLLEAEP